jgi:hypothetical protein
MYASVNFKTKKAFKEAVVSGQKITLYAPGLGAPKHDGVDTVSGPWYPEPHRWYAEVTMERGFVKAVR